MDSQTRRILSLLSLSSKAGALLAGDAACSNALKCGTAELIIVCCDASANTKKKFSKKAFYYKKRYCEPFDGETLNGATGFTNRAVFAVVGKSFADRLKELLQLGLER